MVLVIKHGATKKEIAKIMKQLSALPPTKYLDAKRFCGTVTFALPPDGNKMK